MAWKDTLLQASFKGVEFDIEAVSDSAQRSVSLNEYPYRDGADVEDLGLGPNRIRFTAIVFNQRPRRGPEPAQDDYELRLAQLLAALRSADAGQLQHPVFGNIERAVCTSWTIDHEADFRDGCKLTLEFVEARAADRIFTEPSALLSGETISAQASAARDAADEALIARVELVKLGPMPRQLALRSQMQVALGQLRQLVDTTDLKVLMSDLDPLFFPRAYVADARAVLDRALQGLPFGGRNLLFGGSGSSSSTTSSSNSNSTALGDFTRAAQRLGPSAIALLAPNSDAQVVQAHARVQASATLAEAAAIVLVGELESATLERADIEGVANTARTALQAAIEGMRSAVGVEALGEAAAAGAALRAVAYQVQEAAAAVIQLRPPVVARQAPLSGPLRLVAHALYGDHSRAAELVRLNAWGRKLVADRGEELKAYAR